MLGYPSLRPGNRANFRALGREVSAAIDKDWLQARRQFGAAGFGNVYENIPCHISLQTADNPGIAVSHNPVIMGIIVHIEPHYRLVNGDTVFLKVMNMETGEMLSWYSGVIGAPYISESRQILQLQSWSLGQLLTPPLEFIPPPHPMDATIEIQHFEYGANVPLLPKRTIRTRIGEPFTVEPQEQTGWRLEAFELNGIRHSYSELPYNTTVDRPLVSVLFLWEEIVQDEPFWIGVWRPSATERHYTNAFTIRTGAHFDMLLSIDEWEETGDTATFIIKSGEIRTTGAFAGGMGYVHHESRANVFIDTAAHAMLSTATVFLTQPQQEYWQVITPRPNPATKRVTAQKITPTAAMLAAYVITWTWDD